MFFFPRIRFSMLCRVRVPNQEIEIILFVPLFLSMFVIVDCILTSVHLIDFFLALISSMAEVPATEIIILFLIFPNGHVT